MATMTMIKIRKGPYTTVKAIAAAKAKEGWKDDAQCGSCIVDESETHYVYKVWVK